MCATCATSPCLHTVYCALRDHAAKCDQIEMSWGLVTRHAVIYRYLNAPSQVFENMRDQDLRWCRMEMNVIATAIICLWSELQCWVCDPDSGFVFVVTYECLRSRSKLFECDQHWICLLGIRIAVIFSQYRSQWHVCEHDHECLFVQDCNSMLGIQITIVHLWVRSLLNLLDQDHNCMFFIQITQLCWCWAISKLYCVFLIWMTIVRFGSRLQLAVWK